MNKRVKSVDNFHITKRSKSGALVDEEIALESIISASESEPETEEELAAENNNNDSGSGSDSDSDDDIVWNDVDLELPQEVNVSEKIVISKKVDRQPAVSAESVARRRKIELSNRQKSLRLTTHILHTQALLHYSYIRNEWINDKKLQRDLKRLLPKQLHSAFKKHAKHVESGKNVRKPDEVIDNLSVLVTKLAVYFRSVFVIDRQGLIVNGYNKSPLDSEDFLLSSSARESFCDLEDFRQSAKELRGSRDLGAQLFTCILRSLGVEARLIFSPPLLGYTLHKRDDYKVAPAGAAAGAAVDSHLAYPIFWSEIFDPKLKCYIPIDSLILPIPNYEDLTTGKIAQERPAQFEPSGTFAGSQKMYYVIAYEQDMNCKDLTGKYMAKKNLPQLITVMNSKSLARPTTTSFKDISYIIYLRSVSIMARSAVVVTEQTKKSQLEDKQVQGWIQQSSDSNEIYPNVLSAYKSHPTLILQSKLNKSQALKPSSTPVHSFAIKTVKGTRTETVYLLKDVVSCRPQAAWYKEGRVIKPSEKPLIIEKVKPSTRNGKRRLESTIKYSENPAAATTSDSIEQGLYSYEQTMLYTPPEVLPGQPIPRNEFGRIEIFTPNMIPKGTVHLKHPGLAKIAKKLQIDYVPAVVGFTFQSKFAKPDIDGGIVPNLLVDTLLDAWRLDQKIKNEKESTIRTEHALKRWKLYLARIQLIKRLEQKYGQS